MAYESIFNDTERYESIKGNFEEDSFNVLLKEKENDNFVVLNIFKRNSNWVKLSCYEEGKLNVNLEGDDPEEIIKNLKESFDLKLLTSEELDEYL